LRQWLTMMSFTVSVYRTATAVIVYENLHLPYNTHTYIYIIYLCIQYFNITAYTLIFINVYYVPYIYTNTVVEYNIVAVVCMGDFCLGTLVYRITVHIPVCIYIYIYIHILLYFCCTFDAKYVLRQKSLTSVNDIVRHSAIILLVLSLCISSRQSCHRQENRMPLLRTQQRNNNYDNRNIMHLIGI